MKTFSRRVVGFAFVVLLGATTAAHASDFRFNVPVNLQNMHTDARTAAVECLVSPAGGGTAIARSNSTIPLDSNGNYRGTIVVDANAAPGANPSAARRYTCTLIVNDTYVFDRGGAAFESRPGSTRTVTVQGDIPR
jgi:hypothetical protein